MWSTCFLLTLVGALGGFKATPGLSVPNPDSLKFLTAHVISGRQEIDDVT